MQKQESQGITKEEAEFSGTFNYTRHPIYPRIQRMKDMEKRKFVENDGKYGVSTKGCIERARYMIESLKQTEGEAYVIRRAKAFANYFAKRTIFITDDEQIFHHPGHDLAAIPVWTEIQMWERMVPGEKGHGALHPAAFTPDEWKELEELMKYMHGKTLEEKVLPEIPTDIKDRFCFPPENWKMGINHFFEQAFGGTAANFDSLFKLGYGGILKKVEARMQRPDLDLKKVPLDKAEKIHEIMEKRANLEAMKIAVQATIDLIKRFQKLALEKGANCKDAKRKKEYETMAGNCEKMIDGPIETFHQALQHMWFEHNLTHCCEQMTGCLPHRLDVYLNPYYQRDVFEKKIITRSQAKELLEEWMLKHERSMGVLLPQNMRSGSHGSFIYFQNGSLGGVDPETGRDCTNDMTYLILEACRDTQCGQPTYSIKYNSQTPDELIMAALDVVKSGIGMPAFFHDDVTVKHLLDRGWSLYDARNWTNSGCVATCCQGKNVMPTMPSAGAFNAAKILEATINNGVDICDGQEIGLKFGDPAKVFKTYDDVVDAFMRQFEYTLHSCWIVSQIVLKYDHDLLTKPISAALNPHSIEVGMDLKKSQDMDLPIFGFGCGMIDAIDALAGIKKLIYDEKKVTWDQMLTAMRANWKGYEEIRKLCLEVPKFGEDQPYVDSIARDLFAKCDACARTMHSFVPNPYTGKPEWYEIQYHSVSGFIMSGLKTGALPNGRLSRSPLADGGISPELGFGREPTKVLKSVSWVDATKNQRMLLNMRLNPATTPRQFIDLIRAWGDLNCSQIQFNVFKTETLRDAQAHPEKYPDLMVRVAGYSALFTSLTRVTQEAIIARAETQFSK